MATVNDIKERLKTLTDEVTGVGVLTGEEERLAASAVPAALVRARRASHARSGRDRRRVTRNFDVFVFVSEVKNATSEDDKQAALDAAEPYTDTVADLFYARPRLETSAGVALDGVISTGDMTDSGPTLTPYKSKTYAAIRFTLPVTYLR